MNKLLLLAAALIQLHGPDGQTIFLNPQQITNFRVPRGGEREHFVRGARCLVFLTDGRYLSIQEPCEQLQQQLK